MSRYRTTHVALLVHPCRVSFLPSEASTKILAHRCHPLPPASLYCAKGFSILTARSIAPTSNFAHSRPRTFRSVIFARKAKNNMPRNLSIREKNRKTRCQKALAPTAHLAVCLNRALLTLSRVVRAKLAFLCTETRAYTRTP